MDPKGQRLAELMGLYMISAAAGLAFGIGWLLNSFALMAQVAYINPELLHPSHCFASDERGSAGVWWRGRGSCCGLHSRLAILQPQPGPVASRKRATRCFNQQEIAMVGPFWPTGIQPNPAV